MSRAFEAASGPCPKIRARFGSNPGKSVVRDNRRSTTSPHLAETIGSRDHRCKGCLEEMNFDDGEERAAAPMEAVGASTAAWTRVGVLSAHPRRPVAPIAFDKRELREIFQLYGRMVASGEWRDYALDFTPNHAAFSVFRRTAETPLFRIVKDPRLARKQGIYSVVAATGVVLKRGADLSRVLATLEPRPRLVVV